MPLKLRGGLREWAYALKYLNVSRIDRFLKHRGRITQQELEEIIQALAVVVELS
jgi:hypothetical protein